MAPMHVVRSSIFRANCQQEHVRHSGHAQSPAGALAMQARSTLGVRTGLVYGGNTAVFQRLSSAPVFELTNVSGPMYLFLSWTDADARQWTYHGMFIGCLPVFHGNTTK